MTITHQETRVTEMRERLWRAVELSGLSKTQFYKRFFSLTRARRGKSLATSMFETCFVAGPFEGNTVALEWLDRACVLIDCDVRWVITGESSAASRAASVTLVPHLGGLVASDREKLLALIAMIPQPRERPGECCYCGCTDEFGCGDCQWVDGAHTICSACLMLED